MSTKYFLLYIMKSMQFFTLRSKICRLEIHSIYKPFLLPDKHFFQKISLPPEYNPNEKPFQRIQYNLWTYYRNFTLFHGKFLFYIGVCFDVIYCITPLTQTKLAFLLVYLFACKLTRLTRNSADSNLILIPLEGSS